MTVNNHLDLYTDYLLVNPSYSTTTGLSRVTDGKVSHDQITRLLSGDKLSSKTLWEYVKPLCHEIRSPEGLLNNRRFDRAKTTHQVQCLN